MNLKTLQSEFKKRNLIKDCHFDDFNAQAVKEEMALFLSLPVTFNNFENTEGLVDQELSLKCIGKIPENKDKGYVPYYQFDIMLNDIKIGEINLRIGHTESLYYGGHIGYGIDERYRGNGYAVRACKLVAVMARKHGMTKLYISNRHDNIASIRVCQKLHATYQRTVLLPLDNPMREECSIYNHIWVWDIL